MRSLVLDKVFALLLSMIAVGCDSPTAGDPANTLSSVLVNYSPFTQHGSPEACPNRCVLESMGFARGARGVAATPTQIDHTLNDVLERTDSPGKVTKVTIGQLLEEITSLPPCSAILVHSNGHLWMVVGLVRIDKDVKVQLVHGNESGMLASMQDILSGDFREAWKIEQRPNTTTINVGTGRLEIDSVHKNIGLVQPSVPVTATFVLQNTGHSPLNLTKFESSCSCTTANLNGTIVLQDGEKYDLEITLTPNNLASQKQYVVLNIQDSQDRIAVKQRLTVYASQREPLQVSPSTVDFGAIVPGSCSKRILRVREASTIRFTQASIDVIDLPMRHSVTREVNKSGFSMYKFDLELQPTEQVPGVYKKTLAINTNSLTNPSAKIPILYEILPTTAVEPPSLSVGTVGVNHSRVDILKIYSLNSVIKSARMLNSPKECSILQSLDNGKVELIVTTTLVTPGVWQDKIVLQVHTDTGDQKLEIQCTGLARKDQPTMSSLYSPLSATDMCE